MFQFPRFPSARRRMVRHCLRTGLPHSGIPGLAGTTAYRGFSQPCRALHRPPMPRHPPRALNILTDPSLLSQGVLEGALCSFVKVLLGGIATRAVVSRKTVGLMLEADRSVCISPSLLSIWLLSRSGGFPKTPFLASHPGWWSRGDSNPRPPPCKGGALPVELRPLPTTHFGGPSWIRTRDLGLIRTAL